MKKLINRIDFLWKGDTDSLVAIWLAIFLAAAVLIDLSLIFILTFFYKPFAD